MKDVVEFQKQAGSHVHESTEEPGMMIVGEVVPDWVRLPPQLGGGRRVVAGHRTCRCPCGSPHEVRELDLGENLFVAECGIKGFLWYNRK